MKIRYLLAASVAALLTTGSAKAADIIHYQEPVIPVYSWQGAYVGAQIGGAWSDTSIRFDHEYSVSPDPSGFIGGLYAGYNVDVGNSVVLGIETDFLWTDLSKTKTRTFDDDDVISSRLKEKWAGATRIRAGYAADRWLPYITAGVAYGKIEGRVTDGDGNRYDASKTKTGWTAGAGIDYAMTDNILLRLEYRYTDFGKKTFDYGDNSLRTKFKTNDFRVGVAYKF